MDWASVVPGAITGVVGIAGIGGSIASAKLAGKSAAQNLQTSIAAENEHARRADKRQVYIRYQVSLTEILGAINNLRHRGEHLSSRESKIRIDLVDKAFAPMDRAMTEMWLAAPDEIAYLADHIAGVLWHYVHDMKSNLKPVMPDIVGERTKLYRAMSADLGEPVDQQVGEVSQATPRRPGASPTPAT